MAEISLNDIMRLSACDLRKQLTDRGLDTSGTRWSHAVRLAVFVDLELVTCCPKLRNLVKETLKLPDAVAVVAVPDRKEAAVQCEAPEPEDLDAVAVPDTKEAAVQCEVSEPEEPQRTTPHSSRYRLRPSLGGKSDSSAPISDDPAEDEKVKEMRRLAQYNCPTTGKSETWLRYKIDSDGTELVGCSLCQAYASSGHALHGRQAFGRFELRVAEKTVQARDAVHGHVHKATSDHSKALAFMRKGIVDAGGKIRIQRQISISVQEENAIHFAYCALRQGLTGYEYQAMAKACYEVEANLPDGHNGRRFFSEICRCTANRSFDILLQQVQASPVLSVNVDEGVSGTGYFAIRVHFLDESCCPTSSFWQMRHLSSKTHDVLCQQVLLSLTTKSEAGQGLTKQDVMERLVGFTADGASVNGVRKGSTPISAPIRGPTGNLAHSLLQEKRQFSEECSAHRVDLTCKKFDEQEYVGGIMQMLRRICSHEDASQGGQLHFAPQRFVSHAVPAKVLVRSFKDSRDQNQAAWARHIKADVRTVKVWLVLAVAADLLSFLRKLNVQSQRSSLRVLDLESHVELCIKDVQAYMRQGNGGLASGLKQLFQPYTAPRQAAATLLEELCRQMHVKQTAGGQILSAKYYVGDHEPELELRLNNETLNEVVAVAKDLEKLVLEDLRMRFRNVGISKFVAVLHPTYRPPRDGQPTPLATAVEAFAKHFAMAEGELLSQWKHLLKVKDRYFAANPEVRTMKPHQFWPPILQQVKESLPEAFRVVSSLILLSYQNCEVERDLAILKLARNFRKQTFCTVHFTDSGCCHLKAMH
ncbi:unnamed protein product [Symbiodinium sp. CCMP2592]|nr:unnamed protein product [Symbiodinium sp. CCMP2592]